MSEWQPIETAPKDGTEVLGYRSDCGVILIRYTSCDAFMTDYELLGLSEEDIFSEDWFYADFVAGGRLVDEEIPRLWMPLPEPPTEEKS